MSLNFTEDYKGQNLIPLDSKKSPASPDARSETPEIHVIIKEEEEGWTVSENSEWLPFSSPKIQPMFQRLCKVLNCDFSSFYFNTDESFGSEEREDTCTRLPLVDGKERSPSYEGKGNEQVHSDDSESFSWRELEHRRSPGIVAAHRRIKKAKSSGRKRKMKSLQQSSVAEELLAKDGSGNLPQSSYSQPEPWETAGSSICQPVSEDHWR